MIVGGGNLGSAHNNSVLLGTNSEKPIIRPATPVIKPPSVPPDQPDRTNIPSELRSRPKIPRTPVKGSKPGALSSVPPAPIEEISQAGSVVPQSPSPLPEVEERKVVVVEEKAAAEGVGMRTGDGDGGGEEVLPEPKSKEKDPMSETQMVRGWVM